MINYPKLKTNFAEGDDFIGTIISWINIVTNVKKWMVVNFGLLARHDCANIDVFTSYTFGKGELYIYLWVYQTVVVLGKGELFSNLHI